MGAYLAYRCAIHRVCSLCPIIHALDGPHMLADIPLGILSILVSSWLRSHVVPVVGWATVQTLRFHGGLTACPTLSSVH